jgi:hypothetical protein
MIAGRYGGDLSPKKSLIPRGGTDTTDKTRELESPVLEGNRGEGCHLAYSSLRGRLTDMQRRIPDDYRSTSIRDPSK